MPKEEYQDLYMIMRDQFKDIADSWHEATDASKHVFEVFSTHVSPIPGILSANDSEGYLNCHVLNPTLETYISSAGLSACRRQAATLARVGEAAEWIPGFWVSGFSPSYIAPSHS